MLPIAAPTIAPATAASTGGVLSGEPSGVADKAITAGIADQAGIDPGLFALLLAPLAGTATVVAPMPTSTPGEPIQQVDVGLGQLLSTFLGEASTPVEEAHEDGELLALLASFDATSQTPLPATLSDQLPAEAATLAVTSIPLPPAITIDPAAEAGPTALLAPITATAIPLQPSDGGAVDATGPVAPTAGLSAPAVPTAPGEAPILAAAIAGPAPRTGPASAPPAADTPVAVPAAPAEGMADGASAAAMATLLPSAIPQSGEAGRKPPLQPIARAPTQRQAVTGTAPSAGAESPPVDGPASEPTRPAEAAPPPVTAAIMPEPSPAAAAPVIAPAPTPPTEAMPRTPATPAIPAAQPAMAASDVHAPPDTVAEARPTAPASGSAFATDGSGLALASAPRAEPPPVIVRSEAMQPAGRPEPNPLERAVAHQVSRAIVQHLPDGGARMVMRLTPPELGTVRIEFISRDGMVTARLMAEDEGVRQALDRALPHIRAEVRGDHPAVDISVDRSEQRQAWSEGHARQERRDEPRAGQGRRQREDDPVFAIDGAEPAAVATPVRAAWQLGGRVGPTLVDALA